MPKFVIEREVPGVGRWSMEEVRAAAKRSCVVISRMEPRVQWLESFVTGDKFYCVYIAPDESAVRRHAEEAGFPVDRVSEVVRVIDPTTAGAC